MDAMDVAVLAIVFLATLVRSAFGFGEALIAVPLLAFLIPVGVAVPLVCLHSITIAGFVILQDRHRIHFRSASRLVLATAFGIPLGLVLLKSVDETWFKLLLGVVLVVFSSFCLTCREPPRLSDDRWAWAFGFVAGVLGGAYGMNGPPLVLYGALRRWPAPEFRATLQGYFLPASLLGMAGYAVAGLWGPSVNRYYALSLPLALAAIPIGRAANRWMTGGRFVRILHVGLIAVGALLLVQAVRRTLAEASPRPGGAYNSRVLAPSRGNCDE